MNINYSQKKGGLLLLLLLLVAIPIIVLRVSSVLAQSQMLPDHLHLVTYTLVQKNNGTPPTEEIATEKIITLQPLVDNLYRKLQSLPAAPAVINYSCVRTDPSAYQLTFSHQGQTILTANSGYCWIVMLSKNDARQGDGEFITLLKQAETAQ